MKTIDKCAGWFDHTLKSALAERFPELFPRMAVGIAGRGSECFGFDDEISRDHDRMTGVSIWLTDEDEQKYGFQLDRFYRELHRASFPETGAKSPLGFAEHGVERISVFYQRHLGFPGIPDSWQAWLYTPEYAFAEAVNGRVFMDELGEFSRIRQALGEIPEDIRRKKIAGHAVMMAQCGQYNFERCLKHGEAGAAAIALSEFVRHAVSLAFLLERRFAPYYKWMFRAMRRLPELSGLAEPLEKLLTDPADGMQKVQRIEEICAEFIRIFAIQDLPSVSGNYLEPHAFAIMQSIENQQIRALHIMEF